MFEWWHKFIEGRALMHRQFTFRVPVMQLLQGNFAEHEVHERPTFNYMTGVEVYVKLWRENGLCNSLEIWLMYNEYTQAKQDRLVFKSTGSNLDIQMLINEFIGDMK